MSVQLEVIRDGLVGFWPAWKHDSAFDVACDIAVARSVWDSGDADYAKWFNARGNLDSSLRQLFHDLAVSRKLPLS